LILPARRLLNRRDVSEELVHAVLELTIAEADHGARQRLEAEADMANVLQWMSGISVGARGHRGGFDTATLDLRV